MRTGVFIFAIAWLGGAAVPLDATLPEPLYGLRAEHPRLLATAADWAAIEGTASHDSAQQTIRQNVEAAASILLSTPTVRYEKLGKRFLMVSRETLRRVLCLAMAHRTSGNPAYARRATAELRAVAAFPDWNPSHFLDTAEMTAAVALGYDWLFDTLSNEDRRILEEAIARQGLRPALDPNSPDNSWHRRETNWNQVCWGGLTLGALAIADREPELAGRILELAHRNIGFGLKPYAPDGLYPEGPGYWSYGTTYQVLMIESLRTALGTDWSLPASPGFLASATALAHQTGPSGLYFNFSDGWESTDFPPVWLWFARETDAAGLPFPFRRQLDAFLSDRKAATDDRFYALAALWWDRRLARHRADLPLAWVAHGHQPVATLRSSWNDSAATFLAAKGGSASLGHAHMDAGSFVFESDGVRWVRDLGAQNYHSIESRGIALWNRAQDSGRWGIFRLNNRSHNTLVIDGQLQRVAGHATLERFDEGPEPGVVFDLSSVYGDQVTVARRGFRLDRHRRVLIQDELAGLRPGADVRWALVTAAAVELDGPTATLREDGASLFVEVLEPAGALFSVQDATPPNDGINAPNPNRRLLLLHVAAPSSGALSLAVQLTPGSAEPALPPFAADTFPIRRP